MNILPTRFLLITALALSLGLSACDNAVQNEPTQAGSAETATVTLGVSIWDRDGASKALIDNTRTQSVVLEWWTLQGGNSAFNECRSAFSQRQGRVILSPTNPTHTVSLVSGAYCFGATAYDGVEGSGNRLEAVWTGGTLVAGENTVVLTFLNGVWTFVDGQGNPSPIELSNASTLTGFSLSPYGLFEEAGLAKTAIDTGTPFGMMAYLFDWGTETDLNELSSFMHLAQFNGGSSNSSNASSALGGDYNLTQGCSESVYTTNVACDPAVGDTELIVVGMTDLMFNGFASQQRAFPLPAGSVSPDLSQYETTVVDGVTITGHLVESRYGGETVTLVNVGVTRAAAPAAKAAQSANDRINPVTITTYEYAVCGTDSDSSGSIDVGDWVFDAAGMTLDQGGWRCYESGYVAFGSSNQGEYSWGVEQTGGDTGECQSDPVRYGPWGSCYDKNGDGSIDTGTYQLRHYVRRVETFDAFFYPFTAKGSPLPEGFQFYQPY